MSTPRPSSDTPNASGDGLGAPSGDGASGAETVGVTPEAHRRSRGGLLARWAAAGLVALAVLIGGVALLLRTDAARLKIQSIAVQQIANLLADDATVTVERLEGNFWTGARLLGLRIERDGETIASVDTVLVEYDLTTLLSSRFSASELYVGAPSVFIRQRADSTFNISGLLKPAEDDSTKGGFVVDIAEMGLARGYAEMRWYNPDRDSVLVVQNLMLRASDFHSSEDSLVAAIDRLSLVALAPTLRGADTPAARMEIAGAGAFSRQRLALKDLLIESDAGTRVTGMALLRFPQEGDENAIPAFEADLEAAPFALADARAFTGASVYGRPRVRLTADSDGQEVTFALRGALDPETGAGGAQSATVVLDGQVEIEPDGGPLAVSLNGELRRLDPSVLLANPALAADLNGTVSAQLKGRSPQALTGPFEVSLRDSRVGAQVVDRLRVDGQFRTGAVDFSADAAVPGLVTQLKGFARPFDRVPAVEATGTVSEFDLARLTGDPARQGRLRGDFAIEARGTSLETVIGSAAITLDNATFPVGADGRLFQLARSDLDLTMRGGLAAFDANVALASGGQIAAVGSADITDSPIPYQITQGRFTDLDLAVITGNPDQASDITGTFTLDGRGFAPQTADLRAALRLSPSRLPVGAEGLQVASANLDARLRNGSLTFDAAADLGATGAFTARGSAQPFADPLAYDATGSFTRLNLAQITGNPDQESDLTGTFAARGSGIDPATLTSSGTLRLESGYVGARDLDGADVAFRLARGALSLDGTVTLPEGSFALQVTGRPFDAMPTFALGESTCFSDLDVGRLTDNPDLYTDLNGCFQGSISGFDLAVADGSGTITLRPSTVNAAQVTGGQVSFSLNDGAIGATADLRFANDTPAPGDGDAAPEDGRLIAAFQGRPFADDPTYALTGRTEALDVNSLLPSAPTSPLRLTTDFDLTGRGLDPLTAIVSGTIHAEPSSVGLLQIETLDLNFALEEGTLRLDTLLLRSDIANVTGGGQIAVFDTTAATDFHLQAESRDLSPLSDYAGRPITAERVALDLTLQGAAGAPLAINGTVEARTFAAGTILLTGLDATLDATVDLQRVLNGEGIDGSLDTRFDLLQTDALRVEGGDIAVSYDGEDIVLSGDVTVDQDRDIAFDARVEFDPDPVNAPDAIGLDLERADFRFGETKWSLAQPSRVLFGDVITVRGLLLQSDIGGQQIAADGTLDFNGEQNFILTAEEVGIGVFTDLVGFGSLDGTLSATLLLSGPAEAPLLDGSIILDDLTSQGTLFGAMDAEVSYASGRLDLNAVLTHRDGETLSISGYIPQNISLAGGTPEATAGDKNKGVEIRLQSKAFPIAWAQPFLADRGYTDIGGTLRSDVTVTGTQSSPVLNGTAVLNGGRLGVAATGITYQPLYAQLGFQRDRILLEDVRITAADSSANDTKLSVTGDITLQELSVGQLDLTIQPDGFVAIDTRTYDRLVLERGTRPLRLTGTLQSPVLRGAVVLASGDIYLTDELVPPELEPVELTAEQIRLVEARFGRRITKRDTAVSRFSDALDYELDVQIRRNVWIRSESGLPFDIEFSGDIEATKRPFADGSSLFGQIDLVRGNVETLGKRFEVQRGNLVFNGSPLAAQVDLLATLDARLKQGSSRTPIEIQLLVRGNLDQNPAITLRSDQLSDPADIVSVIATGQLSSDLFGANAFAGAASGLALGQISGLVEGAAGDALGLDLVEIDTDGSDLVIRVGKYLTSSLFTSLGYVVVPSPTDRNATDDTRVVAGLDYELMNWLLLQGEYSGERGVGGGLRYEFAW